MMASGGWPEGGTSFWRDGDLIVNNRQVGTHVPQAEGHVVGFHDCSKIGVAIVGASGGRSVVFYVNSLERCRWGLPDGDYHFAVGGAGDVTFEIVDAEAAAAFWAEVPIRQAELDRKAAAKAASAIALQREIVAGRITGFDASDKGEHAILQAGGTKCMGRDPYSSGEYGRGTWSAACGERIGRGGCSEQRIVVQVLDQGGASAVGVISCNASRERKPGEQEGGISIDSHGDSWVHGDRSRCWVDLEGDRKASDGFRVGDMVGVAVLRDHDSWTVALYINSKESFREPLPDGDYRFAVGGCNYDAFGIVGAGAMAAFWAKAGPLRWSPRDHMHFGPATRARAVSLMQLGHRLSLQYATEKQGVLREVWRELVLPLALCENNLWVYVGDSDSDGDDDDDGYCSDTDWARGLGSTWVG